MGSINNELKMSCVSLNHRQFKLIWQLIPGCKLPTVPAMNMISVLIFPEKTLINTITLYPNLFHTFPCISLTNCGSHQEKLLRGVHTDWLPAEAGDWHSRSLGGALQATAHYNKGSEQWDKFVLYFQQAQEQWLCNYTMKRVQLVSAISF